MRRSQRGISLVEATVIIATLATLTAVVAPSIGVYVEDSRNAAAQRDVKAIGGAIVQILRDTGSRCLRLIGNLDCTVQNRVDLLISAGNDPVAVAASVADVTLPDAESATDADVNWLPDPEAPQQQDTMDDQLIQNDNATPYAVPSFTSGGGPRMKLGWRGPYLNGPITGDPWGNKYQANTLFLTVAVDAFDTGGAPDQLQEGLREAGWNRDVLVLSAGANGVVQTSFGGTASGGLTAGGDDVVYVIGGTTR